MHSGHGGVYTGHFEKEKNKSTYLIQTSIISDKNMCQLMHETKKSQNTKILHIFNDEKT